MSAPSEWLWPDIRWQAPQANLIPGPPVTAFGAGGCSSGNQSGGFEVPATLDHSYSFVLPGAFTMPSGFTALGCTLSGMLKVQSGSPSGTLRASCAAAPRIKRGEASAHMLAQTMAMPVLVRRMRRITGVSSGFCSAGGYPGEGCGVHRGRVPSPARVEARFGARFVHVLFGTCCGPAILRIGESPADISVSSCERTHRGD